MGRSLRRVLLAILATLLTGACGGSSPLLHHYWIAGSSGPALPLSELRQNSTLIVVAMPTGENRVHWNSADGKAWSDDLGRSMIYNDQTLEVLETIKGERSSRIIVRNLGGRVDDALFEFEGMSELAVGDTYLLFLEEVDTPTSEGTERALSFVRQHQGVFRLNGEVFESSAGLSVIESDIPSLQ